MLSVCTLYVSFLVYMHTVNVLGFQLCRAGISSNAIIIICDSVQVSTLINSNTLTKTYKDR